MWIYSHWKKSYDLVIRIALFVAWVKIRQNTEWYQNLLNNEITKNFNGAFISPSWKYFIIARIIYRKEFSIVLSNFFTTLPWFLFDIIYNFLIMMLVLIVNRQQSI